MKRLPLLVTLPLLVSLALLSACSGEEPANGPADEAVEAAPSASATPAPAGRSATLTEMPAAFLGYWDAVEGRCANWSDAQLTIKPDSLTFYESLGQVTAVRQPDATTVVVTMAMSGEGDTWTEEATYRLLDGGTVLESSFAQGEGGEPFRRKRCEALVDVPME